MGLYVGPQPQQPPVYTTTAPPWGLAPPQGQPPVVSTATPPQAPPAPTAPPPSWGQGPPVEYERPAIPQVGGVAESREPMGFGAGWENFTRDNSGLLIGAGTALMANAQNPLANPMSEVGQAAMLGGLADTQRRDKAKGEAETEAQKNATIDWLVKYRGMSPAEAKATVDSGMVGEALRRPEENATDDMREYQQAVAQGFQGSFMDYQIKMKEAGRPNTTVNLNDWKIPSGYQLVDQNDPSKGIKPIPGGPGEQMPAELAARVGMADSFLEQAPAIRERLAKGEATGVWDRSQAGFNSSSEQAEVLRQMKSGTDALQRMLTGAGMPMAEAAQYADRYLPTYTDTAESAARKLDQLVMELQRIKDMAMRGRGATNAGASSAGGSSGTTSGGLQWSLEP